MQTRKRRQNVIETPAFRRYVANAVCAEVQVFTHAHSRENPAPFGGVPDAGVDDFVGTLAQQRTTVERKLTARAYEPADRAQRRRLACAVTSQQRNDFALRDVERYTANCRNAAVSDAQVADGQQRHAGAPRYASMTRGSLRTRSGVPSAIFSP